MGLDKFISKDGYKADSPDRNNPYNVIPSNRITMQNVPHPVYGVDNYGQAQMMMPGGEYEFGGDYVTEYPMMQDGGYVMLDGVKSKKEYRGLDKYGQKQYVLLDEKGNELTWGIEPVTRADSASVYSAGKRAKDLYDPVSITNQPAANKYAAAYNDYQDVAHDKLGIQAITLEEHADYKPYEAPKRKREPDIKKMTPRSLKASYTEPTIDTTLREGVPELPEPTIIGYTQKWNPQSKKWTQEPQYQVIGDKNANRMQDGGAYQEMELDDAEIAAMRAQGYRVEEIPEAQNGLSTSVNMPAYQHDPNPTFFDSHPSGVLTPKEYEKQKNKGTLKKTVKQPLDKKAWDIVSHPMTALANSKGGIPDNIGKAIETGNLDRNVLDMAVDVVNPASYINLVSDIERDIEEGNYTTAAFNVATMIPGLKTIGKYADKLKQVKNLPNSPNVHNAGLDDFLTRPLTPFTKNELASGPGRNMNYRKIGNAQGLRDLINKQGAQAPKPMKMKSGLTADTPFFGTAKKPTESYKGIYAVEIDPLNPKYDWTSQVAGTNNYGVAPIDKATGALAKNIPLEDLEVYKKKWFSNNYKKLDKDKLSEGIADGELQRHVENLWKWGTRGAIAHDIYQDDDKDFNDKIYNALIEDNKIEKQLGGAYEEVELSNQEIANMRAQGYIVEEL